MKLAFDAETEAFRAEFGEWIESNSPDPSSIDVPSKSSADAPPWARAWQRKLFDARWLVPGNPPEYGGRNATLIQQFVVQEELHRRRIDVTQNPQGLSIIAPSLLNFGTEEQKEKWAVPLLRADVTAALGMSEPDAGSDLASLRTSAVADGDGFVVNGRKIWTSWAKYARWCLLLARTGTTESRHRGLTALIVDLRSPGIEVSPIIQANGTDELAEVTFDDVVVPAGRIVGTLDGGWDVAMHILSHERGTFAWFRHGFLYQQLLAGAAVGAPPDAPSHWNDTALGNALLDLAAVTATSHAGVQAHAAGNPLGTRAAFTKLLLCAAEQATHDAVLATDTDLAVGLQTSEIALRRQEYLFSRIVTVYGGSQQMQLDTIAKRILKLP